MYDAPSMGFLSIIAISRLRSLAVDFRVGECTAAALAIRIPLIFSEQYLW